jgi:hypothetical protein
METVTSDVTLSKATRLVEWAQSNHFASLEVHLIALFLLIRAVPTLEKHHQWKANAHYHCSFLIRLIECSDEDYQLQCQYARIGAQILSQIASASNDASVFQAISKLAWTLQEFLRNRRQREDCIDIVDVEIIASLGTWLESFEDTQQLSAQLRQLWQLYLFKPNVKKSEGDQNESNDEGENPASLMRRTLHSLLNQSFDANLPPESQQTDDKLELWHSCWLQFILQCELLLSKESVSSVYSELISCWVQSRPPFDTHAIRRRWLSVILLVTQAKVSASNEILSNLLSDPVLSSNLSFVLLTSATSNDTICVSQLDDHNISSRALTYMNLSLLLGKAGCQWMMRASHDHSLHTSKLGRAQRFCVLIRTAVGEWKIQLNRALESTGKNEWTENDSMITQSCGNIIVHAFEFAVALSTDADANTSRKSWVLPEAVLHLQQSLEEVLDAATEYLILRQQDHPIADANVLQVLSVLLTEYDVFDTHRMHTEVDYPLLHALQRSLNVSDTVSRNYLLRCIATTLDQSILENEDSRMATFRDSGLDSEALIQHLRVFWESNPDLRLILRVCHLIETLVSHYEKPLHSFVAVKTCILKWIATTMECKTDVDNQVLSSALSCYVTLQGNDSPNPADVALIYKVMHCESQK